MSHWRLVPIRWLEEDLREMNRQDRHAVLAAAKHFNVFVDQRTWLLDLKLRLTDALAMAQEGVFDWSIQPPLNPISLVAREYGVDPRILTHDDGVLYIVTDQDIEHARQLFREAMAKVAAWYDTHDAATGELTGKDEQ